MDIVHRIGIKAAPSQVYAALATIDGLAGWWTEDTTGHSKPGGHVAFRFHDANGGDIGGFGMDVVELAPERSVRWLVKDGPAEWLGTDIEFVLSQQDGQTIVMFGHRHWRDAGQGGEFMAHCSTKWATFLLSLRDWVETGHGQPAPRDLKISNWH
ncbi:MAG: SRPBCC domain-containing protein [Piscinibacter sp.]